MSGISKSQVSRLCEEIDDRVKTFLERPIEGDWPYIWIDATYLKVRHNGRIVSVAVIFAVPRSRQGVGPILHRGLITDYIFQWVDSAVDFCFISIGLNNKSMSSAVRVAPFVDPPSRRASARACFLA